MPNDSALANFQSVRYELRRMRWHLLCVVGITFFLMTTLGQTQTLPESNQQAGTVSDQAELHQIETAHGIFLKEFYELAISEYQKYLTWFPKGTWAEEAMYRLGACYQKLGQLDQARQQWVATQSEFPSGSFFARISFQLGDMEWKQNRPSEAISFFKVAMDRASDRETRLSSCYHVALIYSQLQKHQSAAPFFRELIKTEKQNPYYAFSLLELGRWMEDSHSLEEARILYGRLWETEAPISYQVEAGLRAVVLDMNAKRWLQASTLLERVVNRDPKAGWIPQANWNLIRCYWNQDRYQDVIRLASETKSTFPKEFQDEVDLMRAHSLRWTRQIPEAIQAYEQFLKKYPKHSERELVLRDRLMLLLVQNATNWDQEASSFLKNYPQNEVAPKILYVLGDHAYVKKDFVTAASIFGSIPLSKLDPSTVAEALYRWLQSLAQIGRTKEALFQIEEFQKRFPKHDYLDSIILLKARLLQQSNQWTQTLTTLREYLEKFPSSLERENILYRIALLQGELRQYQGMRDTCYRLLKDFPRSRMVADAYYWIGWSLFEEKKFEEAIPLLEKARASRPSEYGSLSTDRLIYAHYTLGHRSLLIKEVELLPEVSPPVALEMERWIGQQSLMERDPVNAERSFLRLLNHPQIGNGKLDALRGLATSQAEQGKWKQNVETLERLIRDSSLPEQVFSAKLDLIRALIHTKDFIRAQTLAEEIMQEQIEGMNNARARYLLGEMMSAQNKHQEAAKFYLSVALLYSDPELTPKALKNAIQSFSACGNTNEVTRLQKELQTKYPSSQ